MYLFSLLIRIGYFIGPATVPFLNHELENSSLTGGTQTPYILCLLLFVHADILYKCVYRVIKGCIYCPLDIVTPLQLHIYNHDSKKSCIFWQMI